MNPTSVDTLKVPGASLYYEVGGSGPVLLLISPAGGAAEAGVFAGIAGPLAQSYMVVTYDPRGNSRSSLDGPSEDQRVEVHANDAHRLLAAVGTEPAYVLGSSGGALVGLELGARYPEQVHTLVVHEPPATELLPDRMRWRAFFQEVYDTYRRVGAGPAMEKFSAGVGLEGPETDESGPQSEPSPEMLEAMARIEGNIEFFLAHVMRSFASYVPDIATLEAASSRIVVAGGEASRAHPHPAYQAGVALAEHLGTKVVYFPGHHGGFSTHPDAFAETLHKVLRGG